MIKLVASDLDGTLIPEGTQIMEPGFLKVLEELLKTKCLFYAITGRTYASSIIHFGDLKDRVGMICENGALVAEAGAVTDLIPVEKKFAEEFIGYLWDKKETELMISAPHKVFIHPRTKTFFRYMTEELCNPAQIFHHFNEIDDVIIKLGFFLYDVERDLYRIREDLKSRFGPLAEYNYTGNGWVDVLPKGGGKGEALEKLLKRKNIRPEEVIVFGDGENDISMFKLTPNSYVMEHAEQSVREHAHYTCSSVAETIQSAIDHNMIIC